jgi:L-asparagine transporter-like permease
MDGFFPKGYLTGWLSVIGWAASISSTCSLTGMLLQGLITLTNPTYVPANWHPMLLFWAVLLFCILVNTVISSLLPKFEGLILILHIVGFFAVLIPMVRLGSYTDAHTVFTSFNNGGHWPNSGLSFFVGLTGNAFAFLGK